MRIYCGRNADWQARRGYFVWLIGVSLYFAHDLDVCHYPCGGAL